MKFCFLIFLILFQSMYAQEEGVDCIESTTEAVDCEELPPEEKPASILLNGILLLDSQEHLFDEESLKSIHGLATYCIKLPGSFKKLNRNLKRIYCDQPLTSELIQEIQNEICTFYEDCRHPFILVVVPPQNISSQVLQLVIVEGRVGEVEVSGNRFVSSQRIKNYMGLKKGDLIQLPKIEGALDFVNRNPFRRVNMIYSPGKEFGEANLNFVVEDKRPYRFYVGADNTGIETMGRQRLMAGVTCGNFLGLDQLLTYQYTTAYHLNRFQAHTIQYVVPAPWRHLFNFFGGYSFVKPELGFPIESRKGHSGQISFRYVVPLGGPSRSVQEITCGFDYKNTNTTATFSELIANFGSSVNLSQFVLEYQWHREWSWSRLDVNLNGFYSPGSWLANETNEDYQSLREKAKNEWIYGKGSIRYLQRLGKDFNAILWLQGQYTSASLLPSEQFGIGGYATVRGYDERQLNMDDAFLASLEIRSPLIPLISMIRSKKIKDSLQFLAFVDYGWGRNRTLYEGEPNVAYLLGVGPGLRYTLDPSIAVRLDWGIKLEKKALYTGGDSEVHFSATISY